MGLGILMSGEPVALVLLVGLSSAVLVQVLEREQGVSLPLWPELGATPGTAGSR